MNSKIKNLEKRISKFLSKKEVCIFVLKPEDYHETSVAILDYLTKKLRLSGIYVSLGSSCREVSKFLEENKVNPKKLVFVDCACEGRTKVDNCMPLKGNRSLTELSLTISEACKDSANKFVFFDSMTNVLMYNSIETTERFMHFLINKIKSLGILFIIVSADEEKSNKLLPTMSQFCDNCVKI